MYHSAPINRIYEPVIRVADGTAEVRLRVRPEFFHAAGALHGSVYFKSLDDAAFFATSSRVEDVFVLTVTFNVVLLRPVTEGILTAVGRLVHRSRSLFVAEAELLADTGKPVARGGGTFMRSTTPLGPELGYR